MRRRTFYLCVALLTLGNLWAPCIFSQTTTTGEVAGVAVDSSGAVVPNAVVLLRNAETGDLRTLRSSAAGAYRFTFLRPGTYQISATASGLKSDVGRLAVGVNQVQVVNLTLTLAETKEVVLVTDAAPLLQTDNANLVSAFSGNQIEWLPSPGGDLTNIALTVPGVAVNTKYGMGNFASHGMPTVSNLFTMNGVDIMDPTFNVNNSGATAMTLGANEIREASVVQNGYDGQYGRLAGAQVNFISKSGANEYHGNLQHTYNGTSMNANDFFNNAAGVPLTRGLANQYAASVGGRIVRDKLLFFASTEGLRYSTPNTAVVTLPSQALQNYVLRTLPAAQVPFYEKAFRLYNGAPGRNRAIAVTNGNGSLQDSSGGLGCGSLVGTAAGEGGIFGATVSCADSFRTNLQNETSEWLMATRVDYNISDRHRVFARFKMDNGFQPTTSNAISPLFSAISRQPDYEGHVSHTWVASSRLVNNLIASVSYNDYIFSPADLTAAFQAFPVRLNIGEGGSNGSFGFTGLGVGTGTYPQGRRLGQFQLVDDASLSFGGHMVKAGLNYRYNRVSDVSNQRFVRGGRFNLVSLAEFAAGTIDPASGSTYLQSFTPYSIAHLRLANTGVYMQDQWTMRPNLKITAVLRVDRSSDPACTDRCFARLASPFSTLAKGPSIPYNQSIQTALEHVFYDVEPAVPQPRIGIAYQPGWSKGLVIRGGIGLFSDLYPAILITLLTSQSPNVFLPTVRAGQINSGGPGSAPGIAIAAANVFQGGFAQGATLTQLQQSLAPIPFAPPDYLSLPSTLRNSKYIEWNLEVQRQLGEKHVLGVNYVGHRGYDIFLLNQRGNAYANPALYPKGFGGLPSTVPDPRFGVVNQITNDASSNYNALVLSLRRGLAHGLQGRLSYTWSHALDTASNGGFLIYGYDSRNTQINPYDLRSLNYGHADNDVRHNLTADFVWEIPVRFQDRLLKSILGGWTASGKVYARSGMPFSVTNGRIPGLLSPTVSGFVLAEVVDPHVRTSCGRDAVATPCFTYSQFASTAAQTTFGNLPRNSFRGPGYFSADSSLYKTLPIRERLRLTLGASAYNLTNHAHFSEPGQNTGGGGLGLIGGTVSAPGSPYGLYGPTGRILVVTGKLAF